MRFQRVLWRDIAAAALAMVLVGAVPAARAEHAIDLQFQADGASTRAVFSFGGRPSVDDFTPAQTGMASSASFTTTPAISNLLALNPSVQAQAIWTPAAMTPIASNTILAASLDGSSLSLTLPGGGGNGPLVLSNATAGFRFSAVANNARGITANDALFLPGTLDYVGISMEGAFSGAGLQAPAAAAATAVVDLLADPMFSASYSGAGSLASLSQLIVRVQPGVNRTLAAASLSFFDRDGDALADLAPPPVLAPGDFAPAELSLRFSGMAGLALDRADYSSTAAFDAATAFWAASGFDSVGVEEFARWTAAPIPEPSSLLLLLAGMAVVRTAARARRTAAAAQPDQGAARMVKHS